MGGIMIIFFTLGGLPIDMMVFDISSGFCSVVDLVYGYMLR